MKILVIDHMAWTRIMMHAWSAAGVEIIPCVLSTRTIAANPDLRLKVAQALGQLLEKETVDLVIDVDGAAILPLDATLSVWTPDLARVPWIVWWWDDPYTVASFLFRKGDSQDYLDRWLEALKRPRVVQAVWDAVLAREYAGWFGRPVFWLPTGVHTGMFHPDAVPFSRHGFSEADVSFLGEYYTDPPAPPSKEVDRLCEIRVREPGQSYAEMLEARPGELREFQAAWRSAQADNRAGFSPDLLRWKRRVEVEVGRERRCRMLDRILERNPTHHFIGKGWPERFHVKGEIVMEPDILTACYRSACVNLGLGSSRSFTGTAMRCYEIMACGGVLACPARPDFDPAGALEGQAYVAFSSVDELFEKVRELKASPSLARRIGDQARNYVQERHSWTHRLLELFQRLGGKEGRAP